MAPSLEIFCESKKKENNIKSSRKQKRDFLFYKQKNRLTIRNKCGGTTGDPGEGDEGDDADFPAEPVYEQQSQSEGRQLDQRRHEEVNVRVTRQVTRLQGHGHVGGRVHQPESRGFFCLH